MTALCIYEPLTPKKMSDKEPITWWEIIKTVGAWVMPILGLVFMNKWKIWREEKRIEENAKRLEARQLRDMVKESVVEQRLLRSDMKIIIERLSTTDGRVTELHSDFKDFKGVVEKKFDSVDSEFYDLKRQINPK